MLEPFGLTEGTWRAGVATPDVTGNHWYASGTPCFLGRSVIALAADPAARRRSGTVGGSWGIARQYGFTVVDGTQPSWGKGFYGEIRKGA
ncbi:MAG: hypothetical protein ACREEC_02745 [Thermoplasmata archaeon]